MGGFITAQSFSVTPDGRKLTFTETATEGDIRLMELNQPASSVLITASLSAHRESRIDAERANR